MTYRLNATATSKIFGFISLLLLPLASFKFIWAVPPECIVLTAIYMLILSLAQCNITVEKGS